MLTAETLMQKEILHKQVKQIVKTCSTWAEVLQRLEKTFPVYETDLSVRTQIEELSLLPEFPSAARVSEYVVRPRVSVFTDERGFLWSH